MRCTFFIFSSSRLSALRAPRDASISLPTISDATLSVLFRTRFEIADALKPADLVGVNKDSYLILDTLPAEYDSRVKAMEVDEKPTEDYSDIERVG